MNVKPWARSSLDRALDAGVWGGTSAVVTGAGPGSPAKFQTSADSPPAMSSAAWALTMAALILARFLTMPVSASSRCTSSGPNLATAAGSNPANAARKFSRLRRMVSQDSPDWNASRHSRS